MRRLPLDIVLVALLLATGCESRDRANPFDPGNPDTRGTPSLLNAVAGDGRVDLWWNLSGLDDVAGIRVLRSQAPYPGSPVLRSDSLETVLWEGSGLDPLGFRDTLAANGMTYAYRVQLRTRQGSVASTAVDLATPGASLPWVADQRAGGLSRLTPDGRDLLFTVDPFRIILDFELDPVGGIWAADYGNGAVVHYDSTGTREREWAFGGVNTLAVDRVTGQIWVGSFDQRILRLYDVTGLRVGDDRVLGWTEGMAAAPDGGVWVATRDQDPRFEEGRVVRATRTYTTPFTGFVWPVALGVNPDSTVWVVDRGRPGVFRMTANGSGRQRSPASFLDPVDGSPDGAGGVWVADRGRSGVVHLGVDLAEDRFIHVGPAAGVTWDPAGRRLWVSLASEGRIVVLDESGTVVSNLVTGGWPVHVNGWWRS